MVDYIKDLNIELAGSVQGTLPGMVAEVVKDISTDIDWKIEKESGHMLAIRNVHIYIYEVTSGLPAPLQISNTSGLMINLNRGWSGSN